MHKEWRACAKVDAAALRHNVQKVRELAGGARILAVVKADAYGHGMGWVVSDIGDLVDGFAVATLDEAIACREITAHHPVVVLSGMQSEKNLPLFQGFNLQAVVHNVEQVKWLIAATGKPLDIWLKLDSGMHRLGLAGEDFAAAFSKLKGSAQIRSIKLMSHFATADQLDKDGGDANAKKQLTEFNKHTDKLANEFNCERSLANSAAIMRMPDSHFQWVRAGIMLYGGSPLLGLRGCDLNLRAVMQLQARLIAVKEIAAGEAVGYGREFIAKKKMRVGLVACGYGDGYPRVINKHAVVGIGDARAPLIGRVSMDLINIDLSAVKTAAVGDLVTLWGDTPSVDEVAQWADTIPNEILCRVGSRPTREYI